MTITTWKDRVWERATVTGTGSVTLSSTVNVGGFQSFSAAVPTGSQVMYGIFDTVTPAWEVGLGIYTTSTNMLTRATVLESSNADALVNFAGQTCDVQVVISSPVQTSAGAADQGKIPALNQNGVLDTSLGGTGASTESAARLALGAQASGSDGGNILTVTTSTTLTAAQSGSTILPAPTAAITITLPTSVAGLKYRIYGSSSYEVTLSTPSGSIYLPDLSYASTYALPLTTLDFIDVIFDGANWRAFTCGRTIVAPAVNANEAVQWAQVVAGNARNYTAAGKLPNTVYTNSNAFPLFVMVSVYSSASNGGAALLINGSQKAQENFFNASTVLSFFFIVPAGETYEITMTSTASTAFWSEM